MSLQDLVHIFARNICLPKALLFFFMGIATITQIIETTLAQGYGIFLCLV